MERKDGRKRGIANRRGIYTPYPPIRLMIKQGGGNARRATVQSGQKQLTVNSAVAASHAREGGPIVEGRPGAQLPRAIAP